MSSVFSGGLVYEYSEEGSNYGLVKINGDSVEELADFKTLQAAFSKQKNPSGDGGYKSSGKASECPRRSANWEVDGNSLPAMPEPAKKYLDSGAGKGAGLDGEGSQYAGTPSSSTATPGSSTRPSSTQKGSASSLRPSGSSTAPVICALIVLASSLLGTTLL